MTHPSLAQPWFSNPNQTSWSDRVNWELTIIFLGCGLCPVKVFTGHVGLWTRVYSLDTCFIGERTRYLNNLKKKTSWTSGRIKELSKPSVGSIWSRLFGKIIMVQLDQGVYLFIYLFWVKGFLIIEKWVVNCEPETP